MLRHLGYVAMALSIDAATNRTCRLRNATPERLRALIASNLGELRRILEFNVRHGIRLYRVSSNLIPFASHAVNGLSWWEEWGEDLAELGVLLRAHGVRATMHPGQYTVLNSPRAEVVRAALDEVAWHVRLLDALGVDSSGKVVIHVGSTAGGRPEALRRFARVAADMPASWRRRLVVENDERLFGIDDVLELSAMTGLPVVFDVLHHRIHAGTDADAGARMAAAFATWGPDDGAPKVHFSSQAEGGRPGQHADWADLDEFRRFLDASPAAPFDCMLECKQKDRALFRLREGLAGWGIVEAGRAA